MNSATARSSALFVWTLFLGVAASDSALAQERATATRADFTVRSVKNGPWSPPDTWAGMRIPKEGDRVLIARRTRVTYDVDSKAVVRYHQVAGTLSFARDRNTTLNVGIVTIQANDAYAETGFDCHAMTDADKHETTKGARAALEVGTLEEPTSHPHVARICWHYVHGMDKKDGPAQRWGDKIIVRGVTHNNGIIHLVTVNGQQVNTNAIQLGLIDWNIELPIPGDGKISAAAIDEAGNREVLGHGVGLK